MKKLLTFTILLSVFIFHAGVATAQPPAPDAEAYILIDSQTGDVLCQNNSEKTLIPASTTKIITSILPL